MAWKNGGGTTTEIVAEPDGEAGRVYQWRISIADVARDGPFSLFPRFDRISMMIAGNGLVLDAGANGTISLETLFTPASYSGDWPVHGRLTDGPIANFNVIFDRQKVSARVNVVDVTRHLPRFSNRCRTATITLLRGAPVTFDHGAREHRLDIGDTLVANSLSVEPKIHKATSPAQPSLAAVVELCDPLPS